MKLKKISSLLIVVGTLLVFVTGCEVGINPLLFDGAPVVATWEFDQSGTSYTGSTIKDLVEILKDIKNSADSVKVFNITIQVENTGSTPAGTTVSGTATFNSTTVITLSGISLDSLAAERSIFLPLTGLSSNPAGVTELATAILHPTGTVTFGVSGTTSWSPLQIRITLRLYTQVYTHP